MPLHAPRGRIKARQDDPMKEADPVKDGGLTATGPAYMRRCTATNRQGTQCARAPIRGGSVCRLHGGGAPQVKQKAEERLRALVDPALTRLNELMVQTEYPSVAIAATKDVLDRNLGKATETLAVNHSGRIDIAALIRQRKARHDPQP